MTAPSAITITTRAGKGSPLTATEHDTNLTNLKTAIEDISDQVLDSDEDVVFASLTAADIYGSSASGGDLNIESTSHSTKGSITLTSDGGELSVNDSGSTYLGQIKGADTVNAQLNIVDIQSGSADGANLILGKGRGDGVAATDDDTAGSISFNGYNDNATPEYTEMVRIESIIEDVSDGTEDGRLEIKTKSGGSLGNRLTVESAGNVTIENGNLVIGTHGKGIDFSANTDDQGTPSSELLDDYEEGTYTPTVAPATSGSVTVDGDNDLLSYVKIGSLVHVFGTLVITAVTSPTGTLTITLPFTCAQLTDQSGRWGTMISATRIDLTTDDQQLMLIGAEDSALAYFYLMGDGDGFVEHVPGGDESYYLNFSYRAA